MIPIYPLTEESIRTHCGQRIVAVTRDGRQYSGILSKVENGQLIFNDDAATVSKKKNVKKMKKKASTSKAPVNPVQALPPAPVPGGIPIFPGTASPAASYGPGIAGRFVLDLALIVLLFLVVF